MAYHVIEGKVVGKKRENRNRMCTFQRIYRI